MERTISFMNGKGSIGHNTRSFIADNVDASRTPNNITLIHEDIKQAYHKLFDKALKEYNAKQKRKDRQIKSYCNCSEPLRVRSQLLCKTENRKIFFCSDLLLLCG